jgi:hypothetical protein
MNDNIIFIERLSPKEHQAVITRLIHGLADLYLRDKTQLFPYPETMIDESQTSPAPDILLYDHKQEKTMVLIEITHSVGIKKDGSKVQALMNDYDVPEGFVYDYRKQQWYKFDRLTGPVKDNSSFSSMLQVDLNNFLSKTSAV